MHLPTLYLLSRWKRINIRFRLLSSRLVSNIKYAINRANEFRLKRFSDSFDLIHDNYLSQNITEYRFCAKLTS